MQLNSTNDKEQYFVTNNVTLTIFTFFDKVRLQFANVSFEWCDAHAVIYVTSLTGFF